MNIVHLLSQNHLTGAEVYASSLIEHQLAAQHQVYQISNGFFYESHAVKFQREVETKNKLTFIKNILWLRNFIKKQNIHVIHTHSRAAAKLAYWSTLFNQTAAVSSVHGVQHPSISKKIHNQYGQFIIAVCDNIKKHLLLDFGYNEKRIKVIPNPISPKDFYFTKKNSTSGVKKIAIVGRATGPKAVRTQQVIDAIQNKNCEVYLVGSSLKNLNLTRKPEFQIHEVKAKKLNSSDYSDYDLVIGSGRVCMESLITGVPTIAFGESEYFGLITENNFRTAAESNFGDIVHGQLHPKIDLARFENDMNSVLLNTIDSSTLQSLSKITAEYFSSVVVSNKIQRLYESAYFLKNYTCWIPILMYHKIPNEAPKSKHKIYVTKNNFKTHLAFFKWLGFQTLTFADLSKFRKGEIPFSQFPKKPLILTFDDGYKDNLENAAPLLESYGFKAQLFLLADKSIKLNSWDLDDSEPSHEILYGSDRKLWKHSPFEVGSHGFSHKKITELTNELALKELIDSKSSLEKELDLQINTFAFTYGIVDENSSNLAESAGYDYAVNTDSGGFLIEEEPYSIFRVNIFPDENYWTLYKKTSFWYRKYYYLKRKK